MMSWSSAPICRLADIDNSSSRFSIGRDVTKKETFGCKFRIPSRSRFLVSFSVGHSSRASIMMNVLGIIESTNLERFNESSENRGGVFLL